MWWRARFCYNGAVGMADRDRCANRTNRPSRPNHQKKASPTSFWSLVVKQWIDGIAEKVARWLDGMDA
jgi:hypothetical protein